MRILFLVGRLDRPSARFRVQPLRPYFERRGHQCDILPLPAHAVERFRFYRRLPQYDVIVIQHRLLSVIDLWFLRERTRKLMYDLDDAVMYDDHGARNRRRQSRFRAIARTADLVVCGNRFLAEEASRHSHRVTVIPTAIDTERFHPQFRSERGGPVTIGWTGSRSTNPYLNDVLPVLAQLGPQVRLKVMSSHTEGLDFSRLGPVPYEFVTWSAEREVPETASFEIGLMPLPDNLWTRGKCGCKALQYMALGVPAVCSPVGVNADIIEHARNGFLADTPERWLEVLRQLVADPSTRQEIGQAGRRRVEEAYALQLLAERFVDAVEQIAA